jgi:beta-lactam-binding protein with PASTA domain
MRRLGPILLLASLTACSVIPMAGNDPLPMPDVTGKSRADAEAYLKAQGFTGSITVDETYTCDDPDVKELQICFTQPRAGQSTRKTLPVVLYPRQKGTATYPMPDLRGKTADEARAAIMKLGQIEQRLTIEDMDVLMEDCQPRRVCRQDPKPGTMTNEHEYKTLRIAPAE